MVNHMSACGRASGVSQLINTIKVALMSVRKPGEVWAIIMCMGGVGPSIKLLFMLEWFIRCQSDCRGKVGVLNCEIFHLDIFGLYLLHACY